MAGADLTLVVFGNLLQTPGTEAPLGSWISVAGLLLGAVLFLAWQRRPATSWGDPPKAELAIPSYRKSMPRLCQELARMRRYERSLAVLVFDIDRRAGKAEESGRGQGGRELAFAFWHLGAMLRDLLRNSDIVTSDPADDRFVVVLPEANRAQAVLAAQRLRTSLQAATLMRVRTGVAEFPADGLIIEELVKAAENDGHDLRQHGIAMTADS